MKKKLKYILLTTRRLLGLPLVYIGVVLLVLTYLTGLSNHNWIMLFSLLCVVAGIVTYVWRAKKESKY